MMTYQQHLAFVIERTAIIDYYLTVIILRRYFPKRIPLDAKRVAEFTEDFIVNESQRMDFGRKRKLFIAICKRRYPKLQGKYKSLTSGNLKSIGLHRNLLAHSFIDLEDNDNLEKRKYFILVGLDQLTLSTNHKQKLSFNKCDDMRKLIKEVMKDLAQFYNDQKFN